MTLSGGTATFNDKNVGTGKTVTLAGATLSGAMPATTVWTSVARRRRTSRRWRITGSFTAANKVYDGTTSATVLTRGRRWRDRRRRVNLTGGTATFNDKNVGTGKTVTLAGASLAGGGCRQLHAVDSMATTTANITRWRITGSFTAANKVYDGNTSATVLTGRRWAATWAATRSPDRRHGDASRPRTSARARPSP